MFSILDRPTQLCDGISRRELLRVGGLGAFGLSLAQMDQVQAVSLPRGKAKSCILLFLLGGPPQQETWDPKPDAPTEVRGPYKPISSATPGLQVCELMPLHAKCADRYNIIRSVHHGFADHGGGHKRFMTARKPKEPTGFVNDAPAVTSFIEAALS